MDAVNEFVEGNEHNGEQGVPRNEPFLMLAVSTPQGLVDGL